MRASACVGRVGGLAVALGIGVAMTASGAASAWATPEDSTSSGADSANSASSTGMQAPRSSGRGRGGRTASSGSAGGTTTSASAGSRSGTELTAAAASAPASKSSPATKVSTPESAAARLVSPTDGLDLPAAPAPTNVTTESESVVVQSATAVANVEPVATATVPAAPAMVAATAGGMDSAPNPLAGQNPLAPVQSAVSWAVLAAARRERSSAPTAHNLPTTVLSTSDMTGTQSVPDAATLTGTVVRSAAALAASTGSVQALTPVAAVTAADPITAFIGQIQAFVTQIVQAVTGVVNQVVQAVTQAIQAVINVFVPAPTPPNAAPVATAPTVRTPDPATGVVAGQINATDPNGDTLTYSGPTATAKGAVTVDSATGAFSYAPTTTARNTAATVGATATDKSDAFTVTVTDGHGGSATVAVNVVISPTPQQTDPGPQPNNRAPLAGTPLVGTPNASTGVVTGSVTATDADGDPLTYSGPTTTAKGAVTVAANGSFTYTATATSRHAAAQTGAGPAANTDSFTVTISDGKGGATTVPVTVAISPTNTSPVTGTTTVGTPNTSTGVVAGTVTATDANGDTLTYSAPAGTTKGSVNINAASGAFIYTPTTTARTNAAGANATNADKTDTFTVTVIDGFGGSTTVPVSVVVSPTTQNPQANRAPVAGTPTVGTPNASTGVVSGSVTATDADSDPLTYTGSTTTSKGSVTVAANGTFAYAPSAASRHAAARDGATQVETTDNFIVTISDGKGGTATVLISVAVGSANSEPVRGISLVGSPDSSTGMVIGTANATDANNDILTYSAPSSTTKGAVSINAGTGVFTYTPTETARQNAARYGSTAADKIDTVTVTVSDGHGGITPIEVAVQILPVATIPTVGFASPIQSVVEGNSGSTAAPLFVTLSTASNSTVTVDYTFGNFTATNGEDFSGVDGTLTFSPGQTQATLPVTIYGDTIYEGNDNIYITLSNPTGALLVGNNAEGLRSDHVFLGITNDDAATIPTVGFASPIQSVVEGNSGSTAAPLFVTLSTASNSTVTVDYTFGNFTATNGEDFSGVDGTLTFSPGQTQATLPVTIYGDTIYEGNDNIYITLSNPTGALLVGNNAEGLRSDHVFLGITNDDVPSATAT